MSKLVVVSKQDQRAFDKAYAALGKLVSLPATALAASGVSSFLISMFKSVFLESLPMILLILAPQILAKPKLVAVLEKTKEVIDSILARRI